MVKAAMQEPPKEALKVLQALEKQSLIRNYLGVRGTFLKLWKACLKAKLKD